MAELKGKWSRVEGLSKNKHEFCKALQNALPQEEKYTVEYDKNEETGEWTQTLAYGNNFLRALWLMDYGPQKFKSGEQFTHKDLSGSSANSTMTVEGNKLTHETIYGEGDAQVKIFYVREFNGDRMNATIEFEDKNGLYPIKHEAVFEKVK